MTAPAPIAAMAATPQWINYKLVPLPSGKMDKIPIDPTGGHNVDAQSPTNWRTYEQAVATGLPVGFVFTESDPFGFIDLDGCRDPQTGEWNQTAAYVMGVFAGCAMEISQSGTGGHIFFTIPPGAGPHGTRCKALAGEMYTARRFVAFTGAGLVGDCQTVPDAAGYNAFVNLYFPQRPAVCRPQTATGGHLSQCQSGAAQRMTGSYCGGCAHLKTSCRLWGSALVWPTLWIWTRKRSPWRTRTTGAG